MRIEIGVILHILIFMACESDSQKETRASLDGEITDMVMGGMNGKESDLTQEDQCQNQGTALATAPCLAPTETAEYYVDQALQYFDTLDVDADRARVPTYSTDVIRWEWPPWLLLTAYGDADMIQTSDLLRDLDPSTVPYRHCQFFPTQPFARCYIEFEYEEGRCPIYEEFTFNAQGEMSFIEAWSHDLNEPFVGEGQLWGERNDFRRLSTRVPGLGAEGHPSSEQLIEYAHQNNDPALEDLAIRIQDWKYHWAISFGEASDDFFTVGCNQWRSVVSK